MPFGLHINADWLLNISRGGLRELEDNPWQRGIANSIVDILAQFLEWCSDRLAEPHAARAAFQALALPSPDTGGLETILARDDWLSRLRQRLTEAAVVPVWATETRALAFVKPKDAIVPPAPLAKAFTTHPELQPTVLLNGPVLRDDVVGPDARELLSRLDLLTDTSPQDLEQAWEGGLENWWTTLPNEDELRRHLLFSIWAAVAKLTSNDAWKHVRLPCVRSLTGQWLEVSEMTFLNEALPTEREPGGRETRQFLRAVIHDGVRLDDGWVSALRQRKQNEPDRMLFSQVRGWFETHARSISLQDIAKDALKALISSASPDWSPLLPFGHWAKHRERPELLTHVLVESEGELQGKPVTAALLANPYVEHGQDRRRLFPTAPAIAATYFEADPKSGGTYEWRVFFEKALALGKLEVERAVTWCWRGQRQHVARFLGCTEAEITESNNSGYELLDFDIKPSLPSPDASEELRRSVATWLDDGFGALKQTGRRKTSYFYWHKREIVGSKPSSWVTKLSELAWVPCDDGRLRCPKDALPTPDPAREDAPIAQLSSELMAALDQEGLGFSKAIPEATSLRRLLAAGSRLEARELAQVLSDCRQQMTEADRLLFVEALRDLTVPSNGGPRVPLNRIVHRVGGRRGLLGGWIVPLDRIDETLRMELQHPDFPAEFPERTTGGQSMDYILSTWKRARSSPDGLANAVRDVLPMAYAYCLEDCVNDASLLHRWTAVKSDAIVFAERQWIVLAESDSTYLDDIVDRRFLPSHALVRTATAGHLGRSREEQIRTARAIDLQLLSSIVTLDWRVGERTAIVSEWPSRFNIVYNLLQRVRKSERQEGDEPSDDAGAPPVLAATRELAVDVRVGSDTPELGPVNARLHRGVLTVAGRPAEFGADAAKELLREFSFGQRAELAADLTGMLAAIDSGEDFRLSHDKFGRSHVPDYEPTDVSQDGETAEKQGGTSTSQAARTTQAEAQKETDTDAPAGNGGQSGTSEHADAEEGDTSGGESGASDPKDSSYTRDRALAKQNALAKQLKSSLKGEIAPSDGLDGTDEPKTTKRTSGGDLGDEEYREAAAQYEREAGREPEFGDPLQVGWDIRSVDLEKEKDVRLIEVKGKGCLWDDDQVVELSHAQVREAFKATDGSSAGSWYLYVVERTGESDFHVLPIKNPARTAARWILSGKAWRMVADHPKHITVAPIAM